MQEAEAVRVVPPITTKTSSQAGGGVERVQYNSTQKMHAWARRFNRMTSSAAAVLFACVLLMQHVPLRSLARHLSGGPEHGCTEQVCHCGESCSCSHCKHHEPDASSAQGKASSLSEGSSPQGPTFRSCDGTHQGAQGVFTVSKSLLSPSPLPASAWPHLSAFSTLHSFPPPHKSADELFRPPRLSIG